MMQDTSGEQKRHKPQEIAIADLLLRSITRLRDEQFQKDFGEPVKNMTNYEHVRREMPLIRSEDRCRHKNFSAPRCLKQIYAVLRIYEGHLGYLEKDNLTSARLPDVKHWTFSLVQFIRTKMSSPEDTDVQSSSSSLKEESAWMKKIYTHSILYNFTSFLIDANRALKHMNDKGYDYVKTENKGPKWPLEKHQHW
ncbi:interleukin-6 [Astyanax mexicanus]|uniref:interleukin-6 n=1 Tax=Astyanax mexicanus TaxID=7994 RepID=UPI0020CACEDC|nr:interleukin-6 [Astyanax mexicanus]